MTICKRKTTTARYDLPMGVEPHRAVLRVSAFMLVLLASALALGVNTSAAKEKQPPSKTVSGTVYDDAGDPIEGATVELADTQTGKVLVMYSQKTGTYQFAGLSLDHDYKVKATYKGATSPERRISLLDTRTRPVLNLTITKTK